MIASIDLHLKSVSHSFWCLLVDNSFYEFFPVQRLEVFGQNFYVQRHLDAGPYSVDCLCFLLAHRKDVEIYSHLVLIDFLVKNDEALSQVVARYLKLLRQARVILVGLFKRLAKRSVEDEVRKGKVFGDPAESIDDLLVVLWQFCFEDLFKSFLEVVIAAEETREVFNTVLQHQLAP